MLLDWLTKSMLKCTCVLEQHVPSLSLFFSSNDQDQLGDLLTRLFDDSSQGTPLPEPVTPETLDHHQLTIELSNALKQLMAS